MVPNASVSASPSLVDFDRLLDRHERAAAPPCTAEPLSVREEVGVVVIPEGTPDERISDEGSAKRLSSVSAIRDCRVVAFASSVPFPAWSVGEVVAEGGEVAERNQLVDRLLGVVPPFKNPAGVRRVAVAVAERADELSVCVPRDYQCCRHFVSFLHCTPRGAAFAVRG